MPSAASRTLLPAAATRPQVAVGSISANYHGSVKGDSKSRMGEQAQLGAAVQPVEHRLGLCPRPQPLGCPSVQRLPEGRPILIKGAHIRTGCSAAQYVCARLQVLADRPAEGL